MATTAKRGVVALFKKHWNESPEIVGSGVMGLIGVAILVYGGFKYYGADGNNRRYRSHYVVLRHDDPAVQRLKISCDLTSKP